MPAFPVILTSFLLGAHLSLASPTFPRHWPGDFSSYCNAPHVNVSHYEPPEKGVELLHLSVMMRHHKRAPVVLVPKEREINIGVPWDCSGIKRFTYDGSGSRLSNSCEEGQLTAGGFHDSKTHGKDLWDVYHAHLGFLQAVQPSEISVRTTGVLAGMDPSSAKRKWPAHAQPQREIDSLGPSYKCPRADSLVSAAQAAPFWQDVLKKTSALKERLDTVLGTENSPPSFLFYQDILTARVEDAVEIFELGNFEGDYLWHRAETATEYNQLTFGVLFSELADALEAPKHKLALYVAHDSSIVRLAAGLEIFPLRWPRLGSEIVIEIWRDRKSRRFVRVLYDGETVESLKWTPLQDFLGVLRNQVPDHIFERCASVSGKVEGAEGPQEIFTLQ
ncbi:phosphoglycerate mutase-like protein [Lactarius hengduanensis]|nr:phosphoglycerate mutase-like protein [Lactarius hengduanensis]